MIADKERRFLATRRVAHLATANTASSPHVVPVCFVLEKTNVYITIDEKPKRNVKQMLTRVRNILENPSVALVADHYDDEDWTRLGWVMVRGSAQILREGSEHLHAQDLLRLRYPPMAKMDLQPLPVIAIRIHKVSSWGNLTV